MEINRQIEKQIDIQIDICMSNLSCSFSWKWIQYVFSSLLRIHFVLNEPLSSFQRKQMLWAKVILVHPKSNFAITILDIFCCSPYNVIAFPTLRQQNLSLLTYLLDYHDLFCTFVSWLLFCILIPIQLSPFQKTKICFITRCKSLFNSLSKIQISIPFIYYH